MGSNPLYARFLARADELRHQDLSHDVATLRGLSPAQRSEWLVSIIRGAWAIFRSRPYFATAKLIIDPPAEDFAAIWRAQQARYQALHE